MTLDELDRLIQSAAHELGDAHVILCLYTGSLPDFCEPMARDPIPDLLWPIERLATEVSKAKSLNPAVEDGALMFGRETVASPHRLTGWSYRLFPPPATLTTVANKGSAFNSCLLMSQVKGVDALYQIGRGLAWRFQLGLASAL